MQFQYLLWCGEDPERSGFGSDQGLFGVDGDCGGCFQAVWDAAAEAGAPATAALAAPSGAQVTLDVELLSGGAPVVAAGADVLDLGAESTRPGAARPTPKVASKAKVAVPKAPAMTVLPTVPVSDGWPPPCGWKTLRSSTISSSPSSPTRCASTTAAHASSKLPSYVRYRRSVGGSAAAGTAELAAGAVDDRRHPEFLVTRATLIVVHRVAMKCRRENRVVIRIGQQIAGDLHPREIVIRKIVVECSHHPVAIPPGIGECGVLIKAVRVGIPRHVEPMSSPSLAVVRGVQQSIDESFAGIDRLVVHERIHLVQRGRKSGQIK